jgi:hypothetical protein
VNAQHESPARQSAEPEQTRQTLSPLDGALLATLVLAMIAASAAGLREAMYACFAASAGWLIARLAVRPKATAGGSGRSKKKSKLPEGAPASPIERIKWALEATPTGYGIGMLGLGVAFFGLGGDIIWHTVFGVEGGIARVIAPFHLFLFTGAGLLLTSPLRSTWNSPEYEGQLTLRRAIPPILAMVLIISLAVFLFQWMTAFMDWKPSAAVTSLPPSVAHNEGLIEALQMVLLARVLLTGMTLVGVMLLGIRRFRLPFGAFTIAFTIPPLFDQALRNLSQIGIVFAAMATGLVADTLIKVFKPSAERSGACRAVAVGTSFAFAGFFLMATASLYGEKLPFDLTLGTIGLTGVVGLALSAIAIPPGSRHEIALAEAKAEAEAVATEPAAWTPSWDMTPAAPASESETWAPSWETEPAAEPVAAEPDWAPSWADEPEVEVQLEPVAEIAPEPEPVVIDEPELEPVAVDPADRRAVDAADVRFAARVAGAAASRESTVEAVALLGLLRGKDAGEVTQAFDPMLNEDELDELCGDVANRHRDWAARPLDQLDVVYLFMEAISLPAPSDSQAEHDLLGAWGVTRHGKRVLLGLRTGSRDRATAWGALGADLVERGMHPPALVVADGAPGVWRVIRELWPDAATQQCTQCALNDAAEGLDSSQRRDLRARFTAALESARSSAEAREQLEVVLDDFRDEAPARMAVLAHRLDRLTAHVDFPREHRRRLRSATVLDRALGWVANERPVESLSSGASELALLWAVLDLGATGARRMPMSLHTVDQLDQLRRRPIDVMDDVSNLSEA